MLPRVLLYIILFKITIILIVFFATINIVNSICNIISEKDFYIIYISLKIKSFESVFTDSYVPL